MYSKIANRGDKKILCILFKPKIRQERRLKNTKMGQIENKTNSKMVFLNPTISIITLSMNRLRTIIKRQRLLNWI